MGGTYRSRRGTRQDAGPLSDRLGVHDVLAGLPGVTYRMLDYWCRTGKIAIEHEPRGSGTRRQFSAAEAAAIADVAGAYARIETMLEDLRSGRFYTRRLAAHRGHDLGEVGL